MEPSTGRKSEGRGQKKGIDDLTRRDVLLRGSAMGAAFSVSGLLAACGSDGTTGSATGVAEQISGERVQSLTWGIVGQAPPSLDAAVAWNATQEATASLGLEGLVGFDSKQELVPVLATNWSQPNPHQYVFNLRSGVKFSDGSPLTAEDVVYSLDRHFDPANESPLSYFFPNVASVHAQGATKIVINLKRPDAVLPQPLALVPITSQRFAERMGDKFGSASSSSTLMGTGPYVISSYSASSGAEVTRNKFYRGKTPPVVNGSVRYFETPQTMQLATRSGSLAGGFGFPLSEADAWDRLPDVATDYVTKNGLACPYLSFNVEVAPWNDIHVRRAIAYSCDRRGYVNAFVSGKGVPATSFVPPAMWANLGDSAEVQALYSAFPDYSFNLSRAKAELAKSAHPNGFSATVPFNTASPEIGHALVSLSQTLKQLGINLTVKPEPENEWIANLIGHKGLGMAAGVLLPDFVDPTDYMSPLLLSENARAGGVNTANFKNPTVDRLLQAQSASTEPSERAKLLAEALKITGEELPYIGLWWEGPTLGVNEQYAYDGFNALYYAEPWLSAVGKSA